MNVKKSIDKTTPTDEIVGAPDSQQPVIEQPPLHKSPPNIPSIKPLRHLIIGAGIFLAVVTLASLVYAQNIAPKRAPVSYFDRITKAKSFLQSGQLSIKTQQNEVIQDNSLNFRGVYKAGNNNVNVPQYQLDIGGHINYAGASREVAGTVVMTDNTLYARLAKPAVLETLMSGALNQWFKLDQAKCSEPDLVRIQEVLENDILKKLPFKDQKRLGLLPQKIDDRRVTRYEGSIDMSKLTETLEGAAARLETVCGKIADEATKAATKLDIEDFTGHSQIRYELASGRDFDKLRLIVNYQKDTTKSESVLVLATQAYNRPVEITAPTGAVSLEEFITQKVNERLQEQMRLNQLNRLNNPNFDISLACPRGIVNCTLDSALNIVDRTLTGVQGILNALFGPPR